MTIPRPRTHLTTTRAGFSLAELMVVIVIIGMLATLVVPSVLDRLERAKRELAVTEMQVISESIDIYAIENSGVYPARLDALVTEDELGSTYLDERKSDLIDPWGTDYQYDEPPAGTNDYVVYSFAKGGEPGGDGAASDLFVPENAKP